MTAGDVRSRRESARPGRPRDPDIDRSILQATLRLLTAHGYAGMSVEGVAAAAGVGKTAIYRRYPSKAELAAAAVRSVRDDFGPLPNTGSARTDIIQMLTRFQPALQRAGFAMIGALLVEERRNPGLLETFRKRVFRPRRREAIKVLQRGVDRGEIRADADLDVAVDALIGSVLANHVLASGNPGQRIEQTVETIWSGLKVNSRTGESG